MAANKFSIKLGFLDLKKGVTGGNTPSKVYLLALERLCGILTMFRKKFRLVSEVRIGKYNLPKIKRNFIKIQKIMA